MSKAARPLPHASLPASTGGLEEAPEGSDATASSQSGVPYAVQFPEAVRRRLSAGQMFNAYDRVGGGFAIAIGPITDACLIADADDADIANLIVDALRAVAGQPVCICPVSGDPVEDED